MTTAFKLCSLEQMWTQYQFLTHLSIGTYSSLWTQQLVWTQYSTTFEVQLKIFETGPKIYILIFWRVTL